MKKGKQHPANVVDVSSRIMGLLGRRKVDPTTEAMRAFKGLPAVHIQLAKVSAAAVYETLVDCIQQPDEVYVLRAPGTPSHPLPLHLQQCGRFMRPDLSEWKQVNERIEREPFMSDDEQKRLIDVLERMLAK